MPVIIGVIPPRKKLMIFKNCRKDLDAYCAGVDYGEGRQLGIALARLPGSLGEAHPLVRE